MYQEYLEERMGDGLVYRDEGFASYRYFNDGDTPSVYIVDLYVRKDFRKSGIASEMADRIVEIAKRDGKTRLIGSVNSLAKNSTDSIKVLLAYGMEFYKSTPDGLIFKKEI